MVTPFALAALAILGRGPFRLRRHSVEVHAEGLVLGRREDRRALAFEDVDEVWFEIDAVQGRAGASLRALRLIDHQGSAYHVPLGVAGAPAVVDAVLRATSAPLLAEARRALDEGNPLTFRGVVLDWAGITVKGARRPWSEIKLAVVSRGKVRLYRRLPIIAWRTVRLDAIPHPIVFLGLLPARVAKVRVDDAILVPFATSAEQTAALAAQGPEVALRQMLYGGVLFLAGVIVTAVTYSAGGGSYLLAYGPILGGALWFVRGLSAYLSGRGR